MKSSLLKILLATGLLMQSVAMAAQPDALTPTRDLAKEEQNRALVVEFYTKVLIEKRLDLAAQYMREDYIQHNPYAATGRAPFLAFFSEMFKRYPDAEHKIIRTATDGDLVYLHIFARNSADDRGRAVVDILRVENGKIAEHWDVVQNIPEHAANANTMF